MIAATPSGTASFWITRPLGRVTVSSTVPSGEGRAATSSIPCAIPSMRAFVRRRRSSITSPMRSFAFSISSAFAARILSAFAHSASAAAVSAAVRVRSSRAASAGATALLRRMISSVVIFYETSFPQVFLQKYRRARRGPCRWRSPCRSPPPWRSWPPQSSSPYRRCRRMSRCRLPAPRSRA